MHISPSNKRYIGITSMNPLRRWANGHGYFKNIYFKRAILKYGWNNFKHIILEEGLTEEQAQQKEIETIKKYNSNNPKYGYNISSGGEGTNGVPISQEHREKLIEHNSMPIYQFDTDYNYIREFRGAREAARILGLGSKSGILNSCKLTNKTAHGYIWRFKKDIPNPYDKNCIPKYIDKYNIRPIYQIDLFDKKYTKWNSIKEASRKTGFSYDSIYQCCIGKCETFKGYFWRYCDDIDDIEEYVNLNNYKYFHKGSPNKKSVLQCDDNLNVIQWYPSMTNAAEMNGLNRKMIAKACNGAIIEYGGYKWKYA